MITIIIIIKKKVNFITLQICRSRSISQFKFSVLCLCKICFIYFASNYHYNHFQSLNHQQLLPNQKTKPTTTTTTRGLPRRSPPRERGPVKPSSWSRPMPGTTCSSRWRWMASRIVRSRSSAASRKPNPLSADASVHWPSPIIRGSGSQNGTLEM